MTTRRADIVTNQVLNCLAHNTEDVIVRSPPGSGKTRLAERCQAFAKFELKLTCLVAALTNEQADDLASRTARRFPRMRIQRLVSSSYKVPLRLTTLPNLIIAPDPVPGMDSTITTTAKLNEMTAPPEADFLIIDEAWQIRWSDFLPIRGLAPRAILIGDPGQIEPITKVPLRKWADDPTGPHQPAPVVVLHLNQAHLFSLPVSHRLVEDSADLVSDIFYRDLQFTGVTSGEERHLAFQVRGSRRNRIDRILAGAISVGSLATVTLPSATPAEVDGELIAMMKATVDRMLDRRAFVNNGGEAAALRPSDIGVVAPRRAQVSAIRRAFGGLVRDGLFIDTANRFQGLEREVMLALHPLSGIASPSDFDLRPGRLCVSMSRHRTACLLFTRAGIDDSLEGFIHADDRFLGQIEDPAHDGWNAHANLLSRMRESGRILAA